MGWGEGENKKRRNKRNRSKRKIIIRSRRGTRDERECKRGKEKKYRSRRNIYWFLV